MPRTPLSCTLTHTAQNRRVSLRAPLASACGLGEDSRQQITQLFRTRDRALLATSWATNLLRIEAASSRDHRHPGTSMLSNDSLITRENDRQRGDGLLHSLAAAGIGRAHPSLSRCPQSAAALLPVASFHLPVLSSRAAGRCVDAVCIMFAKGCQPSIPLLTAVHRPWAPNAMPLH